MEVAVIQTVRAMSPELRAALYRQLVTRNARFGNNVRLEIPAGEIANEMRKLSITLLNAGAIMRGTGQIPQRVALNQDFCFIVHHAMVDILLKQPDATGIIEKEARTRLFRMGKMLHSLVLASVEHGVLQSVFELTIMDAVSVREMDARLCTLYGSYREYVEGYELHREALRIIRHIIAPYNEEHAEVRLVLRTNNPSDILIELNRNLVIR